MVLSHHQKSKGSVAVEGTVLRIELNRVRVVEHCLLVLLFLDAPISLLLQTIDLKYGGKVYVT